MGRARCLSLALVALLAACSGGDAPPVADTSQPVFAATPAAPGDTTCPPTGLWARCSVIKSLERAGFNAHADAAQDVTEPPLAISGFEIPIGGGRIRVFLYVDSTSRKRDQAKLDPKTFIAPNREPGIARERTIAPSANLLVLMDVLGSRNRERIANAVMAGPPQPPSKQ